MLIFLVVGQCELRLRGRKGERAGIDRYASSYLICLIVLVSNMIIRAY